ncbi:class I SAM-dependent methyltransferase [Myxococcus sp. K15C18031901]|uniref:class I SAM-dependent methyltransferase n=1 Tax=Myxococcus dinghuensis TaxID=2906761 RepID=UPI0020A7DED5|nr:class I SAM-dependent methyltransferase [Myxococcus dinghuensis]MCP3098094.1 class I SAM-dependent methyltransferase [Myxococcus dinghuensis]
MHGPIAALEPTLASKRRFKSMTTEFQMGYPSAAGLILQTSLKKQDAARLESLLGWLAPHTVLEVGSYCGVSTRWLLSCLPDARVECVDPWLSDGVVDTESIFDVMVSPFRERVTKTRAYFGSRNNQAFSVTTSHLSDESTRPGANAVDVPVFVPTRTYDVAFVDGDHRTSSSINAFMLLKECTQAIIYHDANLPTHTAAFEVIIREWAGEWTVTRFGEGEDGLALVSQATRRRSGT